MARRWEEEVLRAALRRFPGSTSEILVEARRNAGFLDMCEELAAAETALANTGSLPADVQAARREECRGWIQRLTQEIEETLAAAKIVPLGPRPPGSSP
jgi:hypothetical protein